MAKMKDYKENVIKIYEKSNLPLKLELTSQTASELIIKIRKLDAYRISIGLNNSIFDLNPQYGKTLAHLSSANSFFKKISFVYEEESFEKVSNIFKKIKLGSDQNWNGNGKDLFKIKEFASVNLSVDSLTNNSEIINHVWSCLKPNQLLITTKDIFNTYPIDTIDASFIDLKTKVKLHIYRKPLVNNGIPSRFGVV
jgi:hypothetical protein